MADENDMDSRTLSRVFHYFPVRHVFVLLGFLAFNLVYAYKVVLSVAIVAMVNSTGDHQVVSDECPVTYGNESFGGELQHGEFHWTPDQQAYLLSSFFYGYVATQIPGGLAAQFFGPKWIFGGGILLAGKEMFINF